MRSSAAMAMALAVALLVPGLAEGQLNGRIITSDQPLPDPGDSVKAWHKALKKAHKTTFTKNATGGWQVHFIGFLRKAPGMNEVNIVFYDVTKRGKREQVHYIPYNVTPTQKTLKSTIRLSADDPVRPDHKYEVRLTRVVKGREDVLAKVTLSFK